MRGQASSRDPYPRLRYTKWQLQNEIRCGNEKQTSLKHQRNWRDKAEGDLRNAEQKNQEVGDKQKYAKVHGYYSTGCAFVQAMQIQSGYCSYKPRTLQLRLRA